ARPGDREHALVHRDRSGAATLWARDRRRTRLGAVAAAHRTRNGSLDLDGNRGPAHRLLERQGHLGLKIGAAGGLAAPAAAASPTPPPPAADEAAEQVPEVPEVAHVEPFGEAFRPNAPPGTGATAPGSAAAAAAETRRDHVAHLVVVLPLLGITQHV